MTYIYHINSIILFSQTLPIHLYRALYLSTELLCDKYDTLLSKAHNRQVAFSQSGSDACSVVLSTTTVCRSARIFRPTYELPLCLPVAPAAHSMLFANNLDQNGSHEQKSRFLPDACEGTKIAGMCMSEPGAGEDS